MNRRQFFTLSAAAAGGALLAEGLSEFVPITPANAWPRGSIERLPASSTKRMAWTVDDGASVSAVRSYLQLLEDHEELKMTMFVLAGAHSWKALAPRISKLAATGRLQLANHTVNHIDLTKATERKIRQELVLAGRFIYNEFGVHDGGYFRPPFGYVDDRVIHIAAENGYTKPVLWYGSTGSSATASAASVWKNCQTWMTDRRIVIDHANSLATVANFAKIRQLLKSRGLATVTLAEAFG